MRWPPPDFVLGGRLAKLCGGWGGVDCAWRGNGEVILGQVLGECVSDMMNEAKKVYAQTGSGDSLSSVASSGDTDSRGAGGRRLDRTSNSSPIGGLKKKEGSFNSTSRTLRLSRASSREEILREFDRVSSPLRGRPEVSYGKSETTCWFEVNVQTNPGDMVVVTGNLLTFGFWDPRNGISLSTHATTYPKWTAVAMVPSGLGTPQTLEEEEAYLKPGAPSHPAHGLRVGRCALTACYAIV